MAVFAEKIARPIGPADMEFYYGGIVLRMALLLSGYDDAGWVAASVRTRIRWLNRAARATCSLFNDSAVAARLPLLARNLQERSK
jgi:hypothetical protein